MVIEIDVRVEESEKERAVNDDQLTVAYQSGPLMSH
jgi:hypothetical protein